MAECQTVRPHSDIRDQIFAGVMDATTTAAITAERDGVLAGIDRAREKAVELGLTVLYWAEDGMWIAEGEKVLLVRGNPKQVAQAEEVLVGLIAKSSGIATAAHKAVSHARGKVAIVSGAWKKMPPDLKFLVREAITTGGANFRIVNQPFIYLDKNYVRMFGGIRETLKAVSGFQDMLKVIQLKGETGGIAAEAEEAVLGGADILMVDTGQTADAETVEAYLTAAGIRDKVKIAFAGGVKIEDIPGLAEKDIDILDIGTQIVDAPLLDFRLDVVEVQRAGEEKNTLLELNLLEKTELWVEDISLNGTNLTDIASVVAETLNLEREEVLVVDVRDHHITLDILRRTIQARDIAGKEEEILDRLARLPGVHLGEDARIHSEGILGLIALPPEEVEETFRRSERMVEEIRARVARRVKVFPSGFEVRGGMIRDTNSPMIAEEFKRRGYNVATGSTMDDDEDSIGMHLLRAVEEGYGLVITTGGVGAEDKDRTVEGLLRVDPTAATPWIVKYQKGSGRHQKAGVRIAVGVVGETTIIALPGPNDEVKVALEVLFRELPHQPGKTVLAERIAGALREVLKAKNQAHESCHFDHHYMCHHSR